MIIMVSTEELHSNLISWIRSYQFKNNASDLHMASILDISISQYKKLINGYTKHIDVYLIYRLYHLTGSLFFEMIGESPEELKLLPAYLKLTGSGKRTVDSIIEYESKLCDAGPDQIRVYTPTQDTGDGMLWDSFSFTTVQINQTVYGNQIDVGFKLSNNNMHPAYFKDDVLLISYRAIRENEIGVFIHVPTRCAYVRKYTTGIDSDGRSYTDLIPVPGCMGKTFRIHSDDVCELEQWHKYGVVISKARI